MSGDWAQDWSVATALLATHWPYWLAVVALVAVVRQIRLRVERAADELQRYHSDEAFRFGPTEEDRA